MITPLREETLINCFLCPVCNKRYVSGSGNISCCVMHAPGDCCHFNDREITEEQIAKALSALDTQKETTL